MYIETSSPRKANETARLSSVVFRPSGPNDSCYLRFWYHMFGQDVDSLNINFRTSVTGPLKGIWNLTGKEMLVRIFFLVLCRGLDFVVACLNLNFSLVGFKSKLKAWETTMWREYHFSHAFQTQVSHARLSLELCITIASALVLNIQRLFLRETVHLVSREPQ